MKLLFERSSYWLLFELFLSNATRSHLTLRKTRNIFVNNKNLFLTSSILGYLETCDHVYQSKDLTCSCSYFFRFTWQDRSKYIFGQNQDLELSNLNE